ncbi:MAG TPA: GPW/gp25 family protein [Thauera sp.]|jgi:phage baseplate assembly protein W|uniref:GPW/gp25 family protein n=1 Tax=Thauera sp. TaxID=1905334 RepID=UPI000F97D25F|nr:GPW/gp25 family protein [Thauera sp.]RTL30222.1 MAG: baseplate assembly protein [Rhodocyclaceae bacterium]HPE02970.1 GPW/gp25 family protein [Thauera sp.]HRV77658.1 GPW/gp25 family protein [Thauera sp.]
MNEPLPRPLIGWPLFAVPDADGRLDWPGLEASVRHAIRVILSTRPGEQLMRPEFGAGLDRLLHAPNNLSTRRQIRDWTMSALSRWERRILLDRVDVLEVPERPSELRVEIAYRLARSGAADAVAVTVRLEEG